MNLTIAKRERQRTQILSRLNINLTTETLLG